MRTRTKKPRPAVQRGPLPSPGRWAKERETGNDGRPLTVYRRGPFRVWRDADREHGDWAASVEERGAERLLGHRPTAREAKILARIQGA